MKTYDERWVVIICDSSFKLIEIIAMKNIEVNIKVNDSVSKIVAAYNLSKFLDFTLTLRNEKVTFGDAMGVTDNNNSTFVMDFGGVEYENNFVITVFSNFLGLYDELTKINTGPINYLRKEMKHFSVSPANYQQLTVLNNQVINIEREVHKKNALILDLMHKKEEMNKELEKINRELEASNATKDRIFSIVGHDLRAPFSNIIQSMSLIAYDQVTFEEFKKKSFFSNLSDSAVKSMHLLENLLEWSKCQLGELSFYPTNIYINGVVSSAIDILRGTALEKKINIVKELGQSLSVYADQRMVEVILRNLISNALKFTNDDGKLNIKLSVEKNFAKIVIIDNGLGMSKEKIDTIFNLNKNNVSYGTKGEKGTGFGLVLCKDLIERNGGSISISSQIGKGSEFAFTVPLSKKN